MKNFSVITLDIINVQKLLLKLFLVGNLLLIICIQGHSQTFTYKAECNGSFAADCWELTNPGNCTAGTQSAKPTNEAQLIALFNKTTGCPVNIIINGNLNITGDVKMGGVFQTITVNTNATLTFEGSIIIAAKSSINFVTNNGFIKVNGNNGITLENGDSDQITKLNVSGNPNNSGNITTTKISLSPRSVLNINSGGEFISKGETAFSGTDININVNGGFFRTQSLSIAGNQNKLNISDGGTVVIDGNVNFAGNNAGLVIGGGSQMEIGGTITATHRSTFSVEQGSQVRMCGPDKTVSGNVDANVTRNGTCVFIGLPVEWLYVNSQFNSTERSATVNWATAKEWENSHFEIERSVNGIKNWEKVGEVQGMGWTDEKTEYSFCDEKLPIGGGNIYYRLKQVDFNLQFEYSKTVVVRVPPLTVTKGKWRVYPNPVNDVNFYIARTELEEISSINVKVLSSNEQMRSAVVANERELTEAVKKGFDKLPKGVFIVEIQWNQKVEYLKVLKN